MSSTDHPFHRLWTRWCKPHLPQLLAGGLALAATNWIAVTIPLRVGAVVDHLHQGSDPRVDIAWIAAFGVSLIGVRTLSRVLIFNPGRAVEADIRKELFHTLLQQQAAFYARRSTGDLISRASNDITFVRALVGFGLMQLMNVSLALTMTGWRMFSLSWKLSLAALVPILLGMVIVRYSTGRIMDLHRQSQAQLGALSDQVLGSLRAAATVQGFRAAPELGQRFEARNGELLETRMRLALLSALAFPALGLGGGVALYLVLRSGGAMALQGQLSVGDVAAFASLLGVLLPPLRSLGWMLSVFQRGRVSLERVFEVLDAPVERPEGPSPQPLPPPGGPSLELRDLSFAWPDSPDQPVLRGISAHIPAGAVVGVIGRTGAGKSTLLQLIARLHNPPAGTLWIRGPVGEAVDITQGSLKQWRQRISFAPQRPFLFSDSIRENIALGINDSAAAVEGSARQAALQVDLSALPQGLDTVVGERGVMLSGGQRQRVALARALHRKSDLLLLDDVLSAVDHETELALIEGLRRLGEGSSRPTVFIVSHRVSALQHADLVLVLDQGRLVDQGSPAELCERPGLYRDTWLAQRPEGEAA